MTSQPDASCINKGHSLKLDQSLHGRRQNILRDEYLVLLALVQSGPYNSNFFFVFFFFKLFITIERYSNFKYIIISVYPQRNDHNALLSGAYL